MNRPLRWYLGEERPPPPRIPKADEPLTEAHALELWLHSTTSVSTAYLASTWNPAGPLTEDEQARIEEYLRTRRGPAGLA